MVRARVLGIEQIVDPMWVVAILEINGATIPARVDCKFDEENVPMLSEGDILEVDLNWDGYPRSLNLATTDALGVHGTGEGTTLIGRVVRQVEGRRFMMDCGSFQLPMEIADEELPEWFCVGSLVEIHVGTTVWADLVEDQE